MCSLVCGCRESGEVVKKETEHVFRLDILVECVY